MAGTPLPYTANPISLFISDVFLFLRLSFTPPGLFGIVWPLWPWPSGKLDELAISWPNAWATTVHVFLLFFQLGFLVAATILPFVLVMPAPVYFGGLVGTVIANSVICDLLLNGVPEQKYLSGLEYAKDPADPEECLIPVNHPGERWVFINGVAVG
jgi:hypothetical protein